MYTNDNKEAQGIIDRIKFQMNKILDEEIVQNFLNKFKKDELTKGLREKILSKLEELRYKYPISFAAAFPDWFTSLPKTEVVFYLKDDLRHFLDEIEYRY